MIKFVGDINYTDGFFDTGFGVGTSIREGRNPFQYIKREDTDIWIGNFEGVASETSNKSGIYTKQFRIDPSLIASINHFDIYGVANNHVMQHGPEAYDNLLLHIENSGTRYVGTDTARSLIFMHQEKKIGILAFSQRPENFEATPLYWSMPEYEEIESELSNLSHCDYRIVYVHWGNEFINYPYVDQKQLAHWMVDCGADLIIGMHPHVLQGYEIYNERYIFYSLGNFVFNMPWMDTKYSATITLDVQNDFAISYDYIHIGDDYFPRVVSKDDIPDRFHFEYLNSLLAAHVENELYYKEVFVAMSRYRKANNAALLRNIFRFKMRDLYDIVVDALKRKLK